MTSPTLSPGPLPARRTSTSIGWGCGHARRRRSIRCTGNWVPQTRRNRRAGDRCSSQPGELPASALLAGLTGVARAELVIDFVTGRVDLAVELAAALLVGKLLGVTGEVLDLIRVLAGEVLGVVEKTHQE